MLKVRPALEEVRQMAGTGRWRVLPLSAEMLSDWLTPIECLRILRGVSNHCYLLESAADREHWGRYTFLGFEPTLDITCRDGEMKVGSVRLTTGDPSRVIRQVLSEYASPRLEGLPPFTGGLVGYFAYDYLHYSEPTARVEVRDTERFQDVDLMLFDRVIAFDHFRQKIVLMVNIPLDDPDTAYRRGSLQLEELARLLHTGGRREDVGGRMTGPVRQLFSREEYCRMVERAKHHIREGDIFQVVLSNRLSVPFEGSLLNAYRILRTINPSPYMFYFCGTDVEVAGASPETLVRLEEGVLHTFPLAGTRPRGRTVEEDEALERDLLSDEKELAEHDMLVDLGRNDLGRVSRFGSVRVEKLHTVERFSHVMHIASTVRGELSEAVDALDAIQSVLPAGTLSGAPKLRACQLIGELEGERRGLYGGAVGYIDFTGNMDVCIAIRVTWKKGGLAYVRSGAGIVADSVPEKEYEECLNKARAVLNALEQAGEVEA